MGVRSTPSTRTSTPSSACTTTGVRPARPRREQYFLGGAKTVRDQLYRFRRKGHLSRYSLSSKTGNLHYHHTHIDQLRSLARMTGDDWFARQAKLLERDERKWRASGPARVAAVPGGARRRVGDRAHREAHGRYDARGRYAWLTGSCAGPRHRRKGTTMIQRAIGIAVGALVTLILLIIMTGRTPGRTTSRPWSSAAWPHSSGRSSSASGWAAAPSSAARTRSRPRCSASSMRSDAQRVADRPREA